MLLAVPDVLTADHVLQARRILQEADWVDGSVTAGHQSSRVKDNMQLPESSPAARELGGIVLAALERNPLFVSAALPSQVFPPLFNRYRGGQSFGTHVDNAIRQVTGTPHRIRTDLSATLFLTGADEYDGGELIVEDTYGTHQRQASGRSHDLVSRDQPSPRSSRDTRRAHRFLFLDSKHDPRRR